MPISVFVSRQSGRLFVRRGFKPLFDVPITIRNPAEPMGTHVFSVMESQNEGTATRWTVVSIPEKSGLIKEVHPGRTKNRSCRTRRARSLSASTFRRMWLIEFLELLTPGSSLIISDHGISRETGKDTDFIVLTR